jgi:hypothetical protein
MSRHPHCSTTGALCYEYRHSHHTNGHKRAARNRNARAANACPANAYNGSTHC